MDERETSIPATLAGTGAPPWAVVLLAEVQATRRELARLAEQQAELAAIVVGGQVGKASHDEQLRDHDKRISRIERFGGWFMGIATAILTAVGAAWAAANIHIGPPRAGG